MPATAATAERRRLRFSLRSLLIATALVGVGLGWLSHEIRRGREIELAVRELAVDEPHDRSFFPSFRYTSSAPPWLRKWLGEYFLATIVSATAHADDDAALAHAPCLRNAVLLVGGTNVTDAGLAHLAGMTGLAQLWLMESAVTDAGLAHLAEATNLTFLLIQDTQVTDAGLVHLEGLTKLTLLQFSDTSVTAAGARTLRHALPNCQILVNGETVE